MAVLGLFFSLGYFNCLELKEQLVPKPVEAVSIDFRGVWLTQRQNVLKEKENQPWFGKEIRYLVWE